MRELWLRTACVMAGGAVGSALRFGVGRWLSSAGPGVLPWGTLSVNALGSFGLGLLLGVQPQSELWRLALGVGLMGGFTTYSAFNAELLLLAERGALGTAAAYLGTTSVGCVLSGALGLLLGRWWVG